MARRTETGPWHETRLRLRPQARGQARRGPGHRARLRAPRCRHSRWRAAGMSWTLENYDVLAVALGEHVLMVGTALVISLVIPLPLGILTAPRPVFYFPPLSLTGVPFSLPPPPPFSVLLPPIRLAPPPP